MEHWFVICLFSIGLLVFMWYMARMIQALYHISWWLSEVVRLSDKRNRILESFPDDDDDLSEMWKRRN